ncbi:MAG TPA: hypothetical protein DHU55_19130, partial [Blastocatellia bacterium]|nr:hypothetical protein [Blastocatellia bacterium]
MESFMFKHGNRRRSQVMGVVLFLFLMMFSAFVVAQQRKQSKQPEKSAQGHRPVARVVPPAAKPSP